MHPTAVHRATLSGRGLGPPLVGTLAVAALWAILAAWRPTTTFHLGPVLFGGGPVGEGVIVVAAVALGAASLGALAADRPRAG